MERRKSSPVSCGSSRVAASDSLYLFSAAWCSTRDKGRMDSQYARALTILSFALYLSSNTDTPGRMYLFPSNACHVARMLRCVFRPCRIYLYTVSCFW